MIMDAIKKPDRIETITGDQIKYWKKFLKPDGTFKDIRVVVSDRASGGIGKGNIITAFPD